MFAIDSIDRRYGDFAAATDTIRPASKEHNEWS